MCRLPAFRELQGSFQIVRNTTGTNKQSTRSGSPTVSRDEEAGTQIVSATNTSFDGESRSVENAVTKTGDGAEHEQTKEPDDEPEEVSPPEN
ncbi:MAG: hypothetical protein WD929_07995 [Steroidobacteraceae bacterium]